MAVPETTAVVYSGSCSVEISREQSPRNHVPVSVVLIQVTDILAGERIAMHETYFEKLS